MRNIHSAFREDEIPLKLSLWCELGYARIAVAVAHEDGATDSYCYLFKRGVASTSGQDANESVIIGTKMGVECNVSS